MSDPLIVASIGDSIFDELESSYYIDSALGIQCWNTSTGEYDTLDPVLETCYNTFGGDPHPGGNHTPTAFTYLVEEIAQRLDKDAYVFDVDTQSGDFPYLYTELLNDNSVLDSNDNIGLLAVNAAAAGSGLWAHNTTIEDMARLDGGGFSEEDVAGFFDVIDALGFIAGVPGEPYPSLEDRVITYQDVLTKADIVSVSIFGNDFMIPELFEFDASLCADVFCMEGQVEPVLFRQNNRVNGDSPGCDFTENETTDDNENTTTQKIVSNCNGVFKTIAEKLDTVLQIFNQDSSNIQSPLIFVVNVASSTIVINGVSIEPWELPTETGVDGISISTDIMYWAPSSSDAAPELMKSEAFWGKGYADLLNICFHGEVYDSAEHPYFAPAGDGSPADMRTAICGDVQTYDNLIIFDVYNQFGLTAQQFLDDPDNDSASFFEDVLAWDEYHASTEFVKYVAKNEIVPSLIDLYADNVSGSSPLLTSDTFNIHFNKKVYEVLADSCDPDDTGDLYFDCKGDCGGDALMDNCGDCDNVNTNDCTQDCNGDWGGSAAEDGCGVCDADPTNDCHLPTLCAGDINEDTIINVLDVINLVNKVLADEPASAMSDLNSNGNLDVTDVTQLVSLILNDTGTCDSNEVICGNNFTADCSSPSQCVANEFLNNTTCDSDNPDYLFNFECVESDCENFECGTIPNGDTCDLPTSCADLATYFGHNLAQVGGDSEESCGVVDAAQDPGTIGCNIYVWVNSLDDVGNYIFTGDTIVDCNHTCVFPDWQGNGDCNEPGGADDNGSDFNCIELSCDGGDCGLQMSDSGECTMPETCDDLLYAFPDALEGDEYFEPIYTGDGESYGWYDYCGVENDNASPGDSCNIYSWNNQLPGIENFQYTSGGIIDCNYKCFPQDWLNISNGYCNNEAIWGDSNCPELGCDHGDCNTFPLDDTCVEATSCEHLETYFNLELAPVGGDAVESCGVVDLAQSAGDTGCGIYVWENAFTDVENFKYTGETVVDCNNTCAFSNWQSNGDCNVADSNGNGSDFNCIELSCDGGDCGLQISDGGECIVPTGCPDLAYLMGVDAEDIQVVGLYGCSVIGDPNFSVIGEPGCLLYSWNEALNDVDSFIYTGETVVDCNSTCTFSDWVGDEVCDVVDMESESGSNLNCSTFNYDGGDCNREPPTDESQEYVPTRESDWIGDNGQYTDPDDDGLF